MSETLGLETLIAGHAERAKVHADVFRRVAPEAVRAQDAASYQLVNDLELRRRRSLEYDLPLALLANTAAGATSDQCREQWRQVLEARARPLAGPVIRADSHMARVATLQPVRDLVIDAILVLAEDRKLDVIGPRYPSFWVFNSGNGLPAKQEIWADPGNGSFGFNHSVSGTVNGRQANSGAGVYVQFVPPIAPGIAQVRPFLPYSFQWSNLSFKSREENSASFGIRVWSWDLGGGDLALEQDYRYVVWSDTSISGYVANSNSPSWLDNQDDGVPGWDSDYAFLWGDEAPYFRTRPRRVYTAAIWCLGTCYSISPENQPGQSIGRLHAQTPWVVIGYQ